MPIQPTDVYVGKSINGRERKRLNDLSGKEWLIHSKSVLMDVSNKQSLKQIEDALEHGVMLSQAPPRDILKKAHPATFSEKDVAKLIRFFTRQGEVVLFNIEADALDCYLNLSQIGVKVAIVVYAMWYEDNPLRVQWADEIAVCNRYNPNRGQESIGSGTYIANVNFASFIPLPTFFKNVLEIQTDTLLSIEKEVNQHLSVKP